MLCCETKLSNSVIVEPYLLINVRPYIYFRFAIDKYFSCNYAIIHWLEKLNI